MSRRREHPWEIMAIFYITDKCRSYGEVAKLFKVKVKQVEKRAASEGWYTQKYAGGMGGILERVLQHLQLGKQNRIIQAVAADAEIHEQMTGKVLDALKGKNGKLHKLKSAGMAMNMAMVAVKYGDRVAKLIEAAARVAATKEGDSPPVTIHAGGATTISVNQFIKSVRQEGKVQIR